jgi:hypothetical protein
MLTANREMGVLGEDMRTGLVWALLLRSRPPLSAFERALSRGKLCG